MADVKEILGLKGATAKGPGKKPKKLNPANTPDKDKPKKSTGLSREISQLTEGLSVPLVPTVRVASKNIEFKQKRKLGNKKAEKWVWCNFRNSARKDGAAFHHWIKSRDEHLDYKFAKFNKTPVILEYTKEQYDQHFQDPDWSKDETDYLLAMCRQYDTRFIIIHDRWHRTPRSVEDLKERFYNVQRKLLQLDANTAEDHPLLKFPFNREQEIERKKQIEKMWRRTKREADEEAEVMAEYERLEQGMNKHQKEAEKVLKHARKSVAQFTPSEEEPVEKKKKKAIRAALWFNNLDFDEYLTRPDPEPVEPRDTSVAEHKQVTEAAESTAVEATTQESADNKIENTPAGPQTPANMKEKHYQMQLRIFSAFEQMQIYARPTAYSPLFAPFNELRNDLLIMFELQKLVAEKCYELQCVREQRRLVQHEQQSLLTLDEPDVTVHMSDD
jgi:DNA methyltransferase 1-associated protein 1